MTRRIISTIQHLFHPQRSNNHRPRVLHPEAFVYFLFIAFFSAFLLHSNIFNSSMGGVLGYASDITPVQVVAQTNAERAKVGLPHVKINPTLSEAALAKGQDMFSQQYWAHTSPTGKEPWAFMQEAGYVYRVAGENLARDFDTTPAMVTAWMNSPTHRANIIHPKYTEIGIAVIDGKLQGVETTLVVQMFGTPQNSVIIEPTIPEVQAAEEVTIAVADTSIQLGTEIEVDEDNPLLATVVLPKTAESPESELSEDLGQDVRTITQQRTTITTVAATPQRILQSFFLALVMVVLMVLIYDFLIIGHRRSTRLVGDNIGHIILFSLVLFLILATRTGVVL